MCKQMEICNFRPHNSNTDSQIPIHVSKCLWCFYNFFIDGIINNLSLSSQDQLSHFYYLSSCKDHYKRHRLIFHISSCTFLVPKLNHFIWFLLGSETCFRPSSASAPTPTGLKFFDPEVRGPKNSWDTVPRFLGPL